MKVRKILHAALKCFMLSLFAAALFALPVCANDGITPTQIDKMAIDPQNWSLHRDKTWNEIKPNPVINWVSELNPAGLDVNTSRLKVQGRKIKGAIILTEYLDRKFISGQPKGSDPLGFKLFKKELVDGIPGGKRGSYEETITRNPVMSVLDYPAAYPGGYDDLGKFWADYLAIPNHDNTQKPLNYGATVDNFWLENSYGKWGAELTPHGVFTIPYFEFELFGSYQNFREVPPSFRYGTPAQASPSLSGSGSARSNSVDSHSTEVARRGGVFGLHTGETANPWGISMDVRGLRVGPAVNFADYDFYFMLHAGYDESGAWQEFGQMQYPTRQAIPWDLGPGPRMLQAEKFFNDYPEWVPIYAARYENGWGNYTDEWLASHFNEANKPGITDKINNVYRKSAFWVDTLAEWKKEFGTEAEKVAGYKFVFKLSQEDWDWANAYHGKDANEGLAGDNSVDDGMYTYTGTAHTTNTRYVPFTSWEGCVGEWSHSSSGTWGTNYGNVGPRPTGVTWDLPRSCQGENDGMGTFAHEFGHIANISDNYGNPWSDNRNAYTEPWEIMSRGSFSGPFGDHARWGVMPIEGSSMPALASNPPKTIWNYFDAGDLLEISIDQLATRAPVVANVVARNVPLNNTYYPNLGVPRFDPATGTGFHKGIRLNFHSGSTGPWIDQAERTNRGYTHFHGTATGSRALRMSVEVIQETGNDSFLHDSGVMLMRHWNITNAGWSIVDSHLYDISMTDFFLDGVTNYYTTAHATQLADALFKAGKSFTDTGYYRAIKDDSGNIIKPGSEWRWEPTDGRPIAGGDTVNEFRDEANKLHFYVFEKQSHKSKFGDFLSYRVGMRHMDAPAVNGNLKLSVKHDGEAKNVKVGNYTKQTYLLTNNGATETDIVRVELLGFLGEGRETFEIVDVTLRNQNTIDPYKVNIRNVPKAFSEQNAVILNDLYSIAPGETVEFDVYIKQISENAMDELADLLTVKVSSETNPGNYVSLAVNGCDDEWDIGCSAAGYGVLVLMLIGVAMPFIFRKK